MSDIMTCKERWLAAIRLKPVDHLPFWPKIGAAYVKAQRTPFCSMNVTALHDWIGSDQHDWVGGCLRDVRHTTAVETATSNGVRTTVYRSPHGELRQVERFDPASDAWHPTRFPVQSRTDIALMREMFEDVTVEVGEAGLRAGDNPRGVRLGEAPCSADVNAGQ